MFCKNCGNELNEGAMFCPKCGEKTGITEKIDEAVNNNSGPGIYSNRNDTNIRTDQIRSEKSSNTPVNDKKKKNKIWIIILGILAVIIVFFSCATVSDSKKSDAKKRVHEYLDMGNHFWEADFTAPNEYKGKSYLICWTEEGTQSYRLMTVVYAPDGIRYRADEFAAYMSYLSMDTTKKGSFTIDSSYYTDGTHFEFKVADPRYGFGFEELSSNYLSKELGGNYDLEYKVISEKDFYDEISSISGYEYKTDDSSLLTEK